MKNKILVIINAYLPGYKRGGPLKTISNMVDAIGDQYDFYIVTSDRDRGESNPYPNISYGSWNQVGKAHVRYSRSRMELIQIYKSAFKSGCYDLIYFQSFFNFFFSIIPLFILSFERNNTPILLAPRGEFGSGALHFKKFKKKLYIFFYNTFVSKRLSINYHCSTKEEEECLVRVLGVKSKCFTALNFPSQHHINYQSIKENSDVLRLVFLARLDPKKNLDYAIKLLCSITDCNISFDIYGVVTVKKFFSHCMSLIKQAPKNISISYCGEMLPQNTLNVLSQYDLFFFPTKNENYGHVIHEALLSGLPVLCSDQTPWHELESRNAGWEIPLSQIESFRTIIRQYYHLSPQMKREMKRNALKYGIDFSCNTQNFNDNISMFNSIISNQFSQ